jgi:hypothetical protein
MNIKSTTIINVIKAWMPDNDLSAWYKKNLIIVKLNTDFRMFGVISVNIMLKP